jgi:hypothetical protein
MSDKAEDRIAEIMSASLTRQIKNEIIALRQRCETAEGLLRDLAPWLQSRYTFDLVSKRVHAHLASLDKEEK